MNWEELAFEACINEFDSLSEVASDFVPDVSGGDSYLSIRSGVMQKISISKPSYLFDLTVASALYSELGLYGFNARSASKDCVWHYFSFRLFADVLINRWGKNKERFFSRSDRIYLKSCWWYFHLCWQGDVDSTMQKIRFFTTDDISQLVERPGIGYRLDFTRELVRQLDNSKNLRAILKLHTARSVVIEPSLTDGFLQGYVSRLISDASKLS
jgi:hypothetical protein